MRPYSLRARVATAVTFVITLVATAILVVFATARIADLRREALSMQQQRLGHVELMVEDLLSIMRQLSHTQTQLIAPLQTHEAFVESLRRLHASTDHSLIYGLGVILEPQGSTMQPFGAYAMTAASGKTVLQLLTNDGPPINPEARWYRAARVARGHIVFLAPYGTKADEYVATVQAFYQKERFAGVAVVTIKQAMLASLIAQELIEGDHLEMLGSSGEVAVSAGKPLSAQTPSNTLTATLRLAPWHLRMTTDMTQYVGDRTAIIFGAMLAACLIWIAGGLAVIWNLRISGLRLKAYELLARSSELERVAYRDALTGLPNRLAILEQVSSLLQTSSRPPFAVFLVDLDRFVVVNDSLGHSVGDSVLVMIAQRIAENLPKEAQLGRIGGDEFIICAELDVLDAALLAAQIIEDINRPVHAGGHDIVVTASVGLVHAHPGYATSIAMLRDADLAMYAAKQSGRSQFAVFNEQMHQRAVERLSLEEKMRAAIENHEFHPHYQPIVEIATGAIVSVEALARWESPDGIAPSEFILAAEQSGLIDAVDAQVFARTCADAKRLSEIAPDLTYSFNVSATTLGRNDLSKQFLSIVEHFGLSPASFKLELTETAFMEHPEQGMRLLEQARELGAQVVIDDFGMGYSSLSYVQRLPISGLKIDRSFVEPIARETRSMEIVKAIVTLAHALGVEVTAEGVETAEQLQILRGLGVNYAQGWHFAKAMPFDELVRYISSYSARSMPPDHVVTARGAA